MVAARQTKLENQRQKKRDGDLIYIKESSPAMSKGNNLQFGHPQVSGETQMQHLQNKAVCGTGKCVGKGWVCKNTRSNYNQILKMCYALSDSLRW